MAPPKHESLAKRLGRFEIRSRLGAGAFGAVYRAYDPVLDREVALKVPRASALEQPGARARFLREPKAAAQLRHPHIVPVFDAGSDGQALYIASAFVEGRTLKAVLEDQPPKLRRTAQIVRQLADALDYAHRMGVVHRDVKPANIMLDAAGQPMLMDFGLARLESSSEEKLTHDGTVIGTPAYMAPEQADGSLGEVGPASDQYSLGIVLYEMLCGETPFSGPPTVVIFDAIHKAPVPPRAKDRTIPRDLETICLKALSKRAQERYATCGQLAEDLRRWLADEPILARRSGLLERGVKWAKREPFLAGLGLGVAILAVASTILAAEFFASRQAMARAVEYEEEQTALARSATEKADEQARLAQEQERLAAESEKSAREKEQAARAALAKLEAEVKARNEAEAAAKAEANRRGKMAEQVKQKESKIAETTAAIDLASRQLKDAQEAQKPLLATAAWEAYLQRLSAADKAYQKKDRAAALQLLENCPADQRGWEWSYLKMLCDGKTPVEIDIPDLPWGGLVLSSNLRFACNRAAGGDAFRIVELPNLKPAAAVRLTGEPAQGTWYLSPAGNALLAQATASDWLLMNLSDRTRTPLHNTGPVGPFSFSPDGKIVLLVEKANPRFDATETPILMSVAAPRVTVELQGSTRDGRQQARSGKVYTNAVRLLGFAFAEEPVLYGIAEVIQSGPAGERTATLRRWRVPAGPDSPIAYDDIAPGLEPDVARLFFEFESVRPSRFRADVLGLSQDAGVLVFSRPVRDLYGSYGPKDTAIYRVESKKIVASIAQDFVALSPDGSRVLLHDRQKGRFTLFSTNAQQELPRLKSLPWESYGATELQMNPEWTRAIMAKPAAVPSIHCWSIAKHSGEN